MGLYGRAGAAVVLCAEDLGRESLVLLALAPWRICEPFVVEHSEKQKLGGKHLPALMILLKSEAIFAIVPWLLLSDGMCWNKKRRGWL